MKQRIFIFLVLLSILVNGQSSWKKMDSKNYVAKGKDGVIKNNLTDYHLYKLSVSSFKKEVVQSSTTQQPINIPNAKGGFSRFYIKETSNFNKPVNPAYGFIKSYTLYGVDDKSATGKISVGSNGVFVSIYSSGHSTFYIDPYVKNSSTYIAYERKHIKNNTLDFKCSVTDVSKKQTVSSYSKKATNDGKLRTYRLALACTDEYSQFHLSQQNIPTTASDTEKKAAVLSAMNTTITRVNGVYERELAIRLTIVLNNNGENDLIFLTPNSNTLSNNNATELVEESQAICDNLIGEANYDIGHTFSTGAGGLAGLGVVCINGSKAKGVTGETNPINDAYNIDLVCHELGHQFGADHTFNGSAGSCSGNRNSGTAMEPGSGSTIMSYAGLCSSQNVQSNSSDYFHSVSIEQIWNTIQTSNNCAVETITNNNVPIANAGLDYTVPKSTPLVLRGEANDPDNDTLTYCWEQIDNETATMPPLSTNTAGPLFRSLPPTESPNRYLPSLSTVLAGQTGSTWEVLPSVARSLNFSLTVRDQHVGGGGTAVDYMTVTVADVNPFVVNTPNSNVTWRVGSTQTITWDKSTTDQPPINCNNVRIKLSTDGGQTFPIVLAESTPNDGSHAITVPNYATSSARILVEAVDNIFYNVNSTNFTIVSNVSTFILENNTAAQSVCSNTNNSVEYKIAASFLNGFNETVAFSAENLPAGTMAVFSPLTTNTSEEIIMTLSNFNAAIAQDYQITVKGSANSITQETTVDLKVFSPSFSAVNLIEPANGSSLVSIVPVLQWQADANALEYKIEIATDNSFTNLVESGTAVTNSYKPISVLKASTKYYWRVQPINECATGNFSNPFSFTTKTPSYCSSSFTDDAGGKEHITNVTFNTFNNNSGNDSQDGYQDFTSVSTTLVTGKEYELQVSFDVVGLQDHCYVFIDWNQDFIFDNATERYDLGSLYTAPNTPAAPGPLKRSITVPSDAALGTTRMRVVIEYFDTTKPYGLGACDADHRREWGETEDYTLVIQNVEPSFTIKNTTGNLSICNLATDRQEVVIDYTPVNSFSDNVTFSVAGLPANAQANFDPVNLNSKGYTILTLSNLNKVVEGEYNLTVTTNSSSKSEATNFILNVNTGLCKSYGNNNSSIGITSVQFGTINNSSTKTTGYSDFRSISTAVSRTDNIPVSVEVNADNNNVATIAWIDWNQDCLFDDNERYDMRTVNSIVVPEDAVLGSTTLRIITKQENGTPVNPCGLYINGEVEEYTLIVEEKFATDTSLFNDLKVYPVPTNGELTVSFRVKTKEGIALKIYNSRGRLVYEQEFSIPSSSFIQKIPLTNLSSGMYFIEIANGGKQVFRKIIVK